MRDRTKRLRKTKFKTLFHHERILAHIEIIALISWRSDQAAVIEVPMCRAGETSTSSVQFAEEASLASEIC